MSCFSNESIYRSDGSLSFMLVAVLILLFQVFMVLGPKINSKNMFRTEGMKVVNRVPAYNNNWQYQQDTQLGPAGTNGFDVSGSAILTEGFLGNGYAESPDMYYPTKIPGQMTFGKDYSGWPAKTKPAAVANPVVAVGPAGNLIPGKVTSEGMFIPTNEGMFVPTNEGYNEGYNEDLWQPTGY